MTTLIKSDVRLRPLERNDLHFVHQINNNSTIMRYWFEEPYEAYVELVQLYDRHIHDQSERRFIIENDEREMVGLVELVEINYIHRRAEFQHDLGRLRLLENINHLGRRYRRGQFRCGFRCQGLHCAC